MFKSLGGGGGNSAAAAAAASTGTTPSSAAAAAAAAVVSGPNTEALCNRLASEIKGQESLHASLLRDLARLAAGPAVSEEDFHATFLKALSRSGLETRSGKIDL